MLLEPFFITVTSLDSSVLPLNIFSSPIKYFHQIIFLTHHAVCCNMLIENENCYLDQYLPSNFFQNTFPSSFHSFLLISGPDLFSLQLCPAWMSLFYNCGELFFFHRYCVHFHMFK